MESIALGEIFNLIPPPDTTVEEGKQEGKYPLYASTTRQPLRTDRPRLSGPALIIGRKHKACIYYCDGPFSASKEFIIATPAEKNCFIQVVPEYAYFYLMGQLNLLTEEMKNKNSLSIAFMQRIRIPVKCIDIQNRIIDTLHKVEPIVRLRESNLLRISQLEKRAFVSFFGDPVLDAERFPFQEPLQNLASVYGGGNYVTMPYPRATEHQPAQLTQTAVTKRIFDPSHNKTISIRESIYDTHFIQQGDVLFSRKSSPRLIGAAAYVYDNVENLVIPDTILRIRCDSKKLSGIYLTYLLNDDNFSKKLKNYSGGTLQTMVNITTTDLKKFPIPYPEPALQLRFEKFILSLQQAERQMTEQLSRLYQLANKVFDNLFAGKEIVNIGLELEILLSKIDPKSDNNDYSAFKSRPLKAKLVRMISQEEKPFAGIELYNRAKQVTFALLKEGDIVQRYDPKRNKMNLLIP